MYSFTKYISRLFAEYLAISWIAFISLLQIFDLLANSEEITKRFPGMLSALFTYSIWRIPEISTFVLPFAVLLALLLTLGRLERNHEIMAFKAAGAPYSFVLLSLLPSIAIVSIVHFYLGDVAVPSSIVYLDQHGLRIDKEKEKEGNEPLWRRDGNTIIQIGATREDGNFLSNVTIYERDNAGKLLRKIDVRQMRYRQSKQDWLLEDVYFFTLSHGEEATQDWEAQYEWKSSLSPADFAELSERPEGLSLGQIASYAFGEKTGPRPDYFYSTWFFRRLIIPVSSFLMILLAAPVSQNLQNRNRNLVYGIASGFALGFLYFIADGLSLSLGESGVLPPILAASIPIFVFGSVGGLVLIRAEGY